jgi:hypothetical protein
MPQRQNCGGCNKLDLTEEPPVQEELILSFVSLSKDNTAILLNDDPKYTVFLPKSITRKDGKEKRKIIEDLILDGCTKYGVFYIGEDNVVKCAKEVVDQLYERPRAAKHVPPPSDPRIKGNNDYFEFLVDCTKKTVKEESALVRQIHYTLLSAYTNDPLNLADIAPTSTGKTYAILQSAKFGPMGQEIRIVGSMTPKVVVREDGVLVDKNMNPIGKEVRRLKNAIARAKSKKKFDAAEEHQDELTDLLDGSAYILDLSNKTLLFLEPPKPELWDLIKPILSHDAWEMEHPFVDKIASGGGLEVKRVITRGWPACIFCSAKDESRWEVWPEIESRFMVVSPNMIKPKYLAGNKLIAQKKGLPNCIKQEVIISDQELQVGKQCFNYLKQQIQKITTATDSPIWIPYAELLADILPADKGTDNRTTNRLYSFLNMSALVRAHLRPRLIIGNEQLVIATLEDLREALHVMQNVTGMPPHKLKFYQEYILPKFKAEKSTALTSRDICDYYNTNAPKGTPPMNTDRLTKTYLEELVNHSYLERQQDEETKTKQYMYTPLVDVDEEHYEEEEKYEGQGEGEDLSNRSKSGPFDQNLHFSKLLLSENHPKIPEDWLKREILELQEHRITPPIFKILDPKGNDIPIDQFIQEYEGSSRNGNGNGKGLKLHDFVIMSTRFDSPKTVKNTTSKEPQGGGDEENTINDRQEDENRSKRSNFDQFNRIIQDAMRIGGNGKSSKGHFTREDFVFELQMLPNEHWTYNEAEQTLHQLLEEGNVQEIEPGKFRPAQKRGSDF